MTKFEEVKLTFSEVIESMSKKEKQLYKRDNSLDEVITYKIILDSEDCDIETAKEFLDLMLITKEKKSYSWYFSNVSEEDIEGLVKKTEESLLSEKDREEIKRLEEEVRIAEEQRLQEEKEENELEYEIKMIFASKQIIRDIKEACEDISQLIYRLKNQVNFMTFYYLVSKKIDINYENYSMVFDWYFNLSEKYVWYKKIDIEYKHNSKKYFESQLNTVQKIYNVLYPAFQVFQAEKKFTEQNFNSKKLPLILVSKVKNENIFGFRKEAGE
ncbi:MAG: hypothetical protein LBV03_01655 [Fusobacteriales bacterium]|jgi:hypothetical protein|nr:hypothetical protein [Fusobacteriales bacterium]